MKKVNLKLILLLIFLLPLTTKAITLDENYYINITKDNKVYDYANLFNEEAEKNIIDQSNEIINKYNIDIVILTTSHQSKITTKMIAESFYDNYNFGIGKNKDGIILVIDMYHREYYITATGSTAKLINDKRIEHILDVMESDMKKKNYYDATKSFLDETAQYIFYHKYPHPIIWIITIVFAIVFAYLRLRHEKNKLNLISDSLDASNYFIDKTIEIEQDEKINTTTHVIRHNRSSSRSSGGFSGRSGGGRRF